MTIASPCDQVQIPARDPANCNLDPPVGPCSATQKDDGNSTPDDRPNTDRHDSPPTAGAPVAQPSDVLDSPARPTIVITTEEHEVNAAAASALALDEGTYQRAGLLVRIVRDTSPATKGIRRPFAPRIEALPPALLRERLAANARWFQQKKTPQGIVEVPTHPPGWCVPAVHARGEWPGLRHLEAVVEYPILRPNGTILSKPGYDVDTCLLLEPTGKLPTISDCPTRADAAAAARLLLDVVSDFPFEQEQHRAAWLAALLTPLARFAFIGPAPLFLVDANVRAAGKGLLLDVVAKIITGERFTIATYTSDEDELRKRITSLALGGERLVLFDNLEGRFGNATLDAALTGTSWEDRLLGGNRTVKSPLLMTWYATGNNVSVGADTSRRVCHVRLESPDEHPEQRENFRHRELLHYIGEHRSTLLAAALTILRAYCYAGKPDIQLPAWGSYEGWSPLVRSAVVWVGLPDPGETRLLLQEQADEAAESMAVLLACWEQLDPERRGLTAAEVVDMCKRHPDLSSSPCLPDLIAAVESLVGRPDSKQLGYKLRSYQRRNFNGRFIDRVGEVHRAARWAAFPVKEFKDRQRPSSSSSSSPPEAVGEDDEDGFPQRSEEEDHEWTA